MFFDDYLDEMLFIIMIRYHIYSLLSNMNKYICPKLTRKAKSRLCISMLVSLMLKGVDMMYEGVAVDFLFATIMITLRYFTHCIHLLNVV